MPAHPVVVFADGAARGNPGPGGWGAIIATPDGEVTELGGGERHTTNNRMELTSIVMALRHLAGTPGPIAVYSDSTYAIRGIRDWIRGWRRRGWVTAEGRPVVNRDLWETLAERVAARGRTGRVAWHYVRGHSGVPGNERVDEIATAFAANKRPALYRGPLIRYDVALFDLPDDTSVPARSARDARRPAAKPYSYLSLVDGELMRHPTWAECEARVKGRSGARFKKTTSAEDEVAIATAWGVSADDL
jgi:ribonuclease HI